jgi:hypothetical protein
MKHGGSDEFGITAPGVVTFVEPALKVLQPGAIDGVVIHDTLRRRLCLREIHGRNSKSPQKQAERNSQDNGQDRFVLNRPGKLAVFVHDIFPENGSLKLWSP